MSESYNDTQEYLLLAIILIGLIVTTILLISMIVVVIRRLCGRRPGRGTVLRAAALLAASVAVATYSWGAVYLTDDESGAHDRCQATVPRDHAGDAIAYEVSFLPLRGLCRVPGVGTFDVRRAPGNVGNPPPAYINPTVAVTTCLALVFFIGIRRFPDDRSSVVEAQPVTGQKD
jgi:hypothetical protein